jgi:hypothetical protein
LVNKLVSDTCHICDSQQLTGRSPGSSQCSNSDWVLRMWQETTQHSGSCCHFYLTSRVAAVLTATGKELLALKKLKKLIFISTQIISHWCKSNITNPHFYPLMCAHAVFPLALIICTNLCYITWHFSSNYTLFISEAKRSNWT